MKKILTLATSLLLLGSCAPENQYTIQGTLQGVEGTVYLVDHNGSPIDSAKVEKGEFEFKGIAEEPKVVFLVDTYSNERNAEVRVPLYLEVGAITINDNEEARLRVATGTPANDANAQYVKAKDALVKEYRDEATTNERREAIDAEYEALNTKALNDNLNNLFGIKMLHSMMYEMTGSEILAQIERFAPELQQTEGMLTLKEMAQQKSKSDVGQPYMEVAQPTKEGKLISLKEVVENKNNKYVLLDFWASWCGPCMGEVPHLVETYKAFHKKGFEIYGVSFDRNEEKWTSTIKDHKMRWIHVSELGKGENQAAKDYSVQSIPSNFLIDCQTGKIIASQLRGEALYAEIEKLLNK